MRNFLEDEVKYYTQFADVMQKKFMQLRYGIKTCSVEYDIELALMRKEIVDYQKNNDCGLESNITVDAGSNSNVILPASTLVLNGSVSPDSTDLTSLLWTQISGPNEAIIVTPGSLTTTVAGLIEGQYEFELSVVTSNGIVADRVSKSVIYIYPKAYAGPDVTQYSPVGSGTLSAPDVPGSYPISTVTWTKIGGPAIGTISANGTYSNLITGNYTFRKTVTDVNGRTSTDDMKFIVLAASIVLNYGWSPTDPYLGLVAGAGFNFQKTMDIGPDQDFVLDFHDMPKFSYPVIEIPASYEVKNYYADSGSEFNQDFIPGDHFRSTFVVNGKRYYTTYGTESFSSGPMDRVTFSKPI